MGFENLKRERETRSCLFSESEKVQKRQTGRNVPKVGQVEITGSNPTEREEQIEHLQKGKLESTSRESKI